MEDGKNGGTPYPAGRARARDARMYNNSMAVIIGQGGIMNSKERMEAAKAAKAEAEAELKRAKADRYRKKTETRSKSGGAGIHVTFYDISMGDRRVKVRRKKR